MTELALAAPSPVPTPTAAPVAAVPAETPESPAGGEFFSALVQQIQDAGALGGEAMPAVASPADDPMKTVTADAELAVDGTILPLPGQVLPLDPGLLQGMTLPIPEEATSAQGVDVAALLMTGGAGRGADGNSANARPRQNTSTLAGAVAQAARQHGQDRPVTPGLIAAVAQQRDNLVPVPTADIESVPGQTTPLPVTASTQASLAHLMATPAQAHSASTNAPVAASAIQVPVSHPDWGQALGQRVQWMVNQQMQNAELHINPPNLGPLEVRINIGQDQQANISFTSPHAVVREAIDAALPRLRDMLGDSGLNLANVNVSQHSFAEQRRQSLPQGGARDTGYGGEPDLMSGDEMQGLKVTGRSGLGLVDYFA